MKKPANLKLYRISKKILLFFLLMTAGSSLPIQAQNILTTIALGADAISFSDFSKIGSGYTTAIQGAFPASDGNFYSGWKKSYVQYVSSTNKKVAQFKTDGAGWLKSPTITSENGFTVTITYSAISDLQVKIGTGIAVSGEYGTTNSTTGTGQEMSVTTSSTSTTFTITNTGKSALYVSKITITPNTSQSGGSETTKKEPDISFAQESYTATLGQAFASPVLNNPDSLSGITYTSSEPGVATVDDSGTVSPLAEGKTTITASFAGNETYEAGTASYTLTVQQAITPTATTFYKPIKSTEELVDGNVCLLHCGSKSIMASSYNTDKKWIDPSGTVTLKNGLYTGNVNAVGYPYEITITQEKGNYALSQSDKYLVPLNSDTYISTSTIAKYSWTISFKATGSVNIMNINDTKRGRSIGYESSSSFFKNMTSGVAVQLFQKQTTLQLKEAAQGWATYYNKGFSYVMPQGVKGYYVTLDMNKGTLSLSLAYDAGAPVPANTPLLLYGVVGTYYPVVINKDITPILDTNYMQGERDDDGMTSAGENVIYYKLTLDDNGENIGFFYGAENGAAFKMNSETTAYLAIPKDEAQQVRSLILDPQATNLSTIQRPKDNTVLYDLSGRRVQHPKPSLYIQNRRVVFRKGGSLY